jgi:glycosyltransferase involved in cell wall biosynthesis
MSWLEAGKARRAADSTITFCPIIVKFQNNVSIDHPAVPAVSIVLPTFNRRSFLPAAFGAIAAQRETSWELIVVDDGSSDKSDEVIAQLSSAMTQPVTYIRQENQGPYAARNTGVDRARGDYIAFYDSDDLWLPHHLSTCVEALRAWNDVDWTYASCELVDLDSGHVFSKNAFYEDGAPRPFMQLANDVRGPWHVITDRGAIRCQIDHGLYCGLQNSVLRRKVFERFRFSSDLRNEAEDQLFAIRALSAGFRLAYVDDVHVRYQVHAENSSGAAKDRSVQRLRRVYEPLIRGYERLATEIPLSNDERSALRRRIARELFWHLGYALWTAGERRDALDAYRRALRAWPWDARQWKTYLLARMRA